MLSNEIRKKFLDYFKKQEHTIVPSSSTVPHDDPTLLFTNAGMNQFKDVFLGKAPRDYKRATSSQKCVRVGGKHNDLDNVGHTKRHMTFFEMLGNFSFGDYFKKEAITFAWEVATTIFKFPEEKLFVSVYAKDEEAFEIWKTIVNEKKISRIPTDDNFWSMGETGPCGPCTELFYDRGPAYGLANSILTDVDGERFLEFWNLVFMEYNRDQNGQLNPLPKPCVDTGSGLERVVALMMDVPSVFQTDILSALIGQVEKISGKKYDPKNKELAPAFHVIADHIRSLSFAIADGAQPSNIERGYVLRKILRRAVRYGRLLGLNQPFLANILPTLVETMGTDFRELKTAESRIAEILTLEEESFFQTLRRGGNILSTIVEKAEKSSKKEISGEDAFKLKDTYGFPLEEILLIAKDTSLSVNLEQYQILEEQARERSRQAKETIHQTAESSVFEDFVSHHGTSTFVGYDHTTITGTIKGILINGKSVDIMEAGQEGLIILDRTPFYTESGGQIGDIGMLTHEKAHFTVKDTRSPYPSVITHSGTLEKGVLMVGEPVLAEIDEKRRSEITKHHTATHLLHYALHQILGPHIRQAGSLVEAKRLRFDFNHHKPLTPEDIRDIERLVNEKIWQNSPVKTYELLYEDVQKHPEIKQFFGEKYGKHVRVVDIENFSKELCGGTHVKELGAIGCFRITKEGSIAKGVRRIEAVTGSYAEEARYQTEDMLNQIAEHLQSPPANLMQSIQDLIKKNEELKEEVSLIRRKQLADLASNLLTRMKKVNKISTLSAVVDIKRNELIELGNELIQKMHSGVLILCQVEDGKCQMLLKVSPDLVSQGIHANELVKNISPLIEGSGGGKKDAAQAGGKNPDGVLSAFEKFEELLQKY